MIAEDCGWLKTMPWENIEVFFAGLKEKYPDLEESVDIFMEMYQMLGADGLADMMTPAD